MNTRGTGLKPSTIRTRGNTDKIGSEKNPIEYIEGDVFGNVYPISKADMAAVKKAEDVAVIETETEVEDDDVF